MARILLLAGSALFCVVMLACGDTSDAPGTATTTAPAAASKAAASVQQMSAEAKQCLELVKSERYAEAIDPCKRALEDASNADVKRAYDEAVAAVQKNAQAAAAKAAADSLSGKPADEAAKDAASSALGNLGAEAK